MEPDKGVSGRIGVGEHLPIFCVGAREVAQSHPPCADTPYAALKGRELVTDCIGKFAPFFAGSERRFRVAGNPGRVRLKAQ